MKDFTEPDEVVHAVAEAADLTPGYVRSVLGDARHIIDRTVCDDWSVLMSPLFLGHRGDPAAEAVIDRFTPEDWADPWGMKTASFDDLAAYCGVPVSQVELFPPAFGFAVMFRLAQFRGLADEDYDEWDRLYAVVDAWRDHLSNTATRYRVTPAGLERDFAAWLASNPEVLRPGYPIKLVKGEHVFSNRRRADFLCEFTEPSQGARPGDLLIIENKTVPVGVEALAQLQDYLRLTREELAEADQQVFGLLICDGTNVALRQALQQVTDIGYATLSEVGYRDHLYRTRGGHREVEPDEMASEPVQLTDAPVPREATSGSELARAARNGSQASAARSL